MAEFLSFRLGAEEHGIDFLKVQENGRYGSTCRRSSAACHNDRKVHRDDSVLRRQRSETSLELLTSEPLGSDLGQVSEGLHDGAVVFVKLVEHG